jgi:hypothetical protein
MATINTVNSLVNALGDVILADNSIEALEKQGQVLSPALRKKLQSAAGQKVLSKDERRRWARRLEELKFQGFSDQIRFKVGQPPQVTFKKLSEGDYDLMVGIRLSVIDQTLAGLYETRTWPARLSPDEAENFFPLSNLRDFSDNIPEVEGLQVGVLHLTTAPTVTAVDSGRLVLRQEFVLDLDVVQAGMPRFTITTLSGTVHMQLPVVAQRDFLDQDKLIIVFGTFDDEDRNDSRLEINSASQVQPRDERSLETLGSFVIDVFNDFLILKTFIERKISLCPKFNVPIGRGFGLQVQRADARAVPDGDGGVLMVGVLIGKDAVELEGAGEPNNLRFNPFVTQASNLFVRTHEEFINKVLDGILQSGLFAKELSFGPVEIEVDGVRAKLKTPNKIQFIVDAHLPNFCTGFIDLNFTATWTARVSVLNGKIHYDVSGVDINLDNSDVAFCVVSSLSTVLIGVFTGEVHFIVIGIVDAWFLLGAGIIELEVEAKSDEETGEFKGIFDLQEPVPGTELVPRLEATQAGVVEGGLEVFGLVTLRPDDLHLFLYLSVRSSLITGLFSKPVKDAIVRVMDQDAPAPSNDDATPPISSFTTTKQGDFITKVRVSFKKPVRNELLAKGTTDKDGRLRLVIDPRSTAGTIITTTTIVDTSVPEPDPFGEKTTTEIKLSEDRPDIFFRVTLPGEDKARDTRSSGGGLFFQPNLSGRRLGEPDAPLTLIFRELSPEDNIGDIT